jgi:hypothetical protein
MLALDLLAQLAKAVFKGAAPSLVPKCSRVDPIPFAETSARMEEHHGDEPKAELWQSTAPLPAVCQTKPKVPVFAAKVEIDIVLAGANRLPSNNRCICHVVFLMAQSAA